MTSCLFFFFFFFFNDTATTEIYTLSLHDALPISGVPAPAFMLRQPIHFAPGATPIWCVAWSSPAKVPAECVPRSEEHTSELQSRRDLVCRLLLEKKKKKKITIAQLHKTIAYLSEK